jgi:hypothetical protein
MNPIAPGFITRGGKTKGLHSPFHVIGLKNQVNVLVIFYQVLRKYHVCLLMT